MNSENDAELEHEARQESANREKGEDKRFDESILVQDEELGAMIKEFEQKAREDQEKATRLEQEREKAERELREAKEKAARWERETREAKEKAARWEREMREAKERWERETSESKEKAARWGREMREAKEKASIWEQEVIELREWDITYSLQNLLETHSGLPTCEMNTAAQPSVGGTPKSKNAFKRIQLMWRDKRSKQYHDPAHIEKMKQEVLDYLNRLKVNFKHKNGQLIKSLIAIKMGEKSADKDAQLANFNEASVSLHVIDVLQDVLQCLNLSSSTRVGQEISIFSMRPDIVVVRWLSKIILVVEVKNPGANSSEVLSNERAAGQVYDYAMGLRQMGIDHPIVCLSTYNHMRIGTVKKCSEGVFEEAIRRLEEGTLGNIDIDKVNEKKDFSPEKGGNLVKIPNDSTQVKHGSKKKKIGRIQAKVCSKKNSDRERVIYFSETFNLENSFKAFYFAIVCGIVAAEESTDSQERTLVPEEGNDFNRYVAVVTKTSFRWEILQSKATYQLKCKWDRRMKVYLHCVLGHGCSGKVYLASDSKGQMFAVKLYIFSSKTMGHFCAENNEKEKISQKKEAEKTRDKEFQKWRQFYPAYKNAIKSTELFGIPCLAMPYVASIPADRRKSLLPEVQEALMMFADKGLSYRSTDLRWRHIGMRKNENGEDKIILVDLESMTGKKTDKAAAEAIALVSSHIKELEKRAPVEPVVGARELCFA